MSDVVFFLLFSPVMEFLALSLFTFSLFRFPLRGFIPHLIFLCLLLSYVAYTLRELGWTSYAPSIQMILFIVGIWLLFRVHSFYAVIMGVTGYHGYIVIQVPILLAMEAAGWANLSQGEGLEWVQFATVLAAGLITWLLRRYQIGFTFIPASDTRRVRFHKYNLIMLAVALLDIVLEGVFILLYKTKVNGLAFLLSTVQFLIMLFFLNYAMKKERNLY